MRKRAFTLLEVMIALTIITIIATLTALPIKKLLDRHRFEKEVGDLFIALQEAQILAACYETDLALDFVKKQGKWSYHFSTDEPFSKDKLNQDVVVLDQVVEMKFGEKRVSTLHVDIYAGGRVEPRGVLGFYCSEDVKDISEKEKAALWIDLQKGHLLKFAYTKPVIIKEKIPEMPKNAFFTYDAKQEGANQVGKKDAKQEGKKVVHPVK